MGDKELARCAICQGRKFAGEVKYSSEHKDYICKDPIKCIKPDDNKNVRAHRKKINKRAVLSF